MPDNQSKIPDHLVEGFKQLKNKKTYLKRNLTVLQKGLGDFTGTPDQIDKIQRQFACCEKGLFAFESLLEEIYDADYEEEFEEHFLSSDIANLFSILKIETIKLTFENSDQKSRIKLHDQNSQVKLPSLSSPVFTGRFDEWLSFRNSFKSVIDTNNSLSDIQKLQYLKSTLKGEAADVIKAIEISGSNYSIAWGLLSERFENKRIIIRNHVRALFDIPAISKENYNGFRQLIDQTTQNLRALASLGRPVDTWDDLIIHITVSKLPHLTRREWDSRNCTADPPAFSDLKSFLIQKCHSLEEFKEQSHIKSIKPASYSLTNNVSNKGFNLKCNYCEGDHGLFSCQALLTLNATERISAIKTKHLCINCLRTGHILKDCKSPNKCKKCNKSHHTLLHLDNNDNKSEPHVNTATSCVASYDLPVCALLSTCEVRIPDIYGNDQVARILLDSGSQVNLITQNFANKLGLEKLESNIAIKGINERVSCINHFINSSVKSSVNNFNVDLKFYIINKISNPLPAVSLEPATICVPRYIKLADPSFHRTANIDALIGSELFYTLLCAKQIKSSRPGIIFQKTKLGWLVAGTFTKSNSRSNSSVSCNLNTSFDLNDRISKFWNIEQNLTAKPLPSTEERDCEVHFNKTVKLNSNREFIVSLPWKGDPLLLGESYNNAKRRLLSIERKFSKNNDLKKQYTEFMREYAEFGHMKEVENFPRSEESSYFLPHHAVMKEDSLTTKLRVVFDASAKTNTGKSLNDLLMVGPVIQDNLFDILVRFRTHQVVVTSDVAKMYRQIKINSNDTKYQRILWRFKPEDRIRCYELLTVTYGTRPASFLATRCLFEIAKHIQTDDSHVAEIIRSDFYMDDLLTGADSVNQLRMICDRINKALFSYGFHLRKWTSNDDRVLNEIFDSRDKNLVLKFDKDDILKTLGLYWLPKGDIIQYQSALKLNEHGITKRALLSSISQIFDPLGLLGPTIIISKLLMQELWQLAIGWDELVPPETFLKWKGFVHELNHLHKLQIPRKIIASPGAELNVIGFCDASERAYGACIYLVSRHSSGNVESYLVCAKSRVAPLKTLTLPRLELCGAVLLAQLMSKVTNSMKRKILNISYYTDSTIALSWIRSCPSRWKTFVSHRVGEIQTASNKAFWHYVKGEENPADIISRGAFPSTLIDNDLWWRGPPWLMAEVGYPIEEPEVEPDIPEARSMLVINQQQEFDLITRYSDFHKLLRVTAICLRVFNKRKQKQVGSPCAEELKTAEIRILRCVQNQGFPNEIKNLSANRPVDSKSRLLCLSPFLDADGLIRVGGRLKNALVSYDVKHPIVLPANNHVTKLIIEAEHIRTLHGGSQTTLANIRSRYWPLNSRSTVRNVLRKCVTCFKTKPTRSTTLMGNLPTSRVEPSLPFVKTGVDYFGPLTIKEGTRKSKRLVKCYGALFVCMITKAVHLELVSNLTTEAFLAALRRFIARRGCVQHLYSDNGTNFVGADKELREMFKIFTQQVHLKKVETVLHNGRIKWHFNPPSAPHFGGLWESSVKLTKYHLRRILNNTCLTFEELTTLLYQIESVINSRPITQMSNDPNDFGFLTPAHFLLGAYPHTLVEPDLTDIKENRLSLWQRIQQLLQHFWATTNKYSNHKRVVVDKV